MTEELPYPANHPEGPRKLRELEDWVKQRLQERLQERLDEEFKLPPNNLSWSDPNSDPMRDMQRMIEYLGGQGSVTMDGIDMTPYLKNARFLPTPMGQTKPTTRFDLHLAESRERVRRQLGTVTHSWRKQ